MVPNVMFLDIKFGVLISRANIELSLQTGAFSDQDLRFKKI